MKHVIFLSACCLSLKFEFFHVEIFDFYVVRCIHFSVCSFSVSCYTKKRLYQVKPMQKSPCFLLGICSSFFSPSSFDPIGISIYFKVWDRDPCSFFSPRLSSSDSNTIFSWRLFLTELLRLWEMCHWGNSMSCGLMGGEGQTLSGDPSRTGWQGGICPLDVEKAEWKAHVRGCIWFFLWLQKQWFLVSSFNFACYTLIPSVDFVTLT